MKEFIEGVFMCIGLGLFYFSAGAMEQGYVGWSLAFLFVGFCFLAMMLALVYERR